MEIEIEIGMHKHHVAANQYCTSKTSREKDIRQGREDAKWTTRRRRTLVEGLESKHVNKLAGTDSPADDRGVRSGSCGAAGK
jgi:hypothetical protein